MRGIVERLVVTKLFVLNRMLSTVSSRGVMGYDVQWCYPFLLKPVIEPNPEPVKSSHLTK
jgi:hypothetical protein